MNTDYRRYLGILMHITSLPSPYGIGDLGKSAYEFAKKAKEAGASLWQILPLGPTGYGNSPYAARSSFAGNELMIDLEDLVEKGYLDPERLSHIPNFPEGKVVFDLLISWKLPLLKEAARSFIAQDGCKSTEYRRFRKASSYWLGDYAAFMTLYERHMDARWFLWPEDEKNHSEMLVKKLSREENFKVYEVLQFFFHEQWIRLHKYVNSLELSLIGDIPIFMGADSADSWSHRELLKCDEQGFYKAVAGVPPDNFSADGQLWGNPVYDWKKCQQEDFRWWIERIRNERERVDIIRIDHFRGFDAYYEIKAGSTTAQKGKWMKAPGRLLFKKMHEELGKLDIIAEDLGFMTESVNRLRCENAWPGMKIAQFGFTRDENGAYNPYDTFLPHNYTRDFVAYTGTHDNDTTLGWYESLSEEDRHMVREYLSSPDEEIVWSLIKAVMLSTADYAIIPMQDILELDTSARMNYPSSCNDRNWSWRMKEGDFNTYRIGRLKHLAKISGRNGLSYQEKVEKEGKYR